jgi:hypothetical protein
VPASAAGRECRSKIVVLDKHLERMSSHYDQVELPFPPDRSEIARPMIPIQLDRIMVEADQIVWLNEVLQLRRDGFGNAGINKYSSPKTKVWPAVAGK